MAKLFLNKLFESKSWTLLTSARYILSYLGFLCTLVIYFCRVNLSIATSQYRIKSYPDQLFWPIPIHLHLAIVAMTERKYSSLNVSETNGTSEFEWGNQKQTTLLSAYFYGYVCTQIVGAWLSSKFGFKWILFTTTLTTSILTILSPFVADWGYGWFFALRVLIGLCHGVTFPVLQGCWTVWGPPVERSQLIAIYIAGNSVGTCLIFPLGGFLAASDWGWRSIFYVTGGCGVAWSVLWLFFAFDTPAKHPRISLEERNYIESSISEYQSTIELPKSTPWIKMLSSIPVWSVATGHLASNWAVYQMNQLLPKYLNDVLNFDIQTNGLISAAPFICQSVLTFVAGWLTDVIRSKNWLRTITIRKINNVIGLAVPGITVVLAGYSYENKALAVTLFTISVGTTAFTIPGCKSSMMDFAPLYGGIVFAISNTFSNLSGFLAPLSTGALLGDDSESNSIKQWQLAFWVTALINIPGIIAFQIFGTETVQEWAKPASQSPELDGKNSNDDGQKSVTDFSQK